MISNDLIQILGHDHVKCDQPYIDKYLQNVCAARRRVTGIVYPQSENEIIKLVNLSRKSRTPLYPISKGYNYGLGSRLPVEDDHLIVDLCRMNRILSFDAELGVIRVEPGVTQQDIANYLEEQNAEFVLNVTGSSAQSSIVGNAIERGVGHYGSRVPEVISMDIILGDGSKFSTGILNNAYSYGLGPDMKGLFFQSNFGVVTNMTLRLMPKTECVAMVSLEKKASIPLDKFIDQLRVAKQKQLLPDNLHISNQLRRLSVVTPLISRQIDVPLAEAVKISKKCIQSDWAANTSLRGERAVLEVQIKCLKNFIQDYASASVVYDTDMSQLSGLFHSATRGAMGHALGIPCDDAILSLGYGLQQTLKGSVEESNIGTLFLIPVVAFRGKDFSNIVNLVTSKFKQYHFEPYMTFNLVEQINLEGVINLSFLKSETNAATAAHLCIQETFSELERSGFPPMRLSIFQKSSFLNKNPALQKLRHGLKHLLDPENIIAHGRYEG